MCYEPLAAESALGSAAFPLPVSYIFGDQDWMGKLEGVPEGIGPKKVVDINQHPGSKLHILEDSDHNMQMDNPEGLARLMIEDLLGPNENFEIVKNEA